MPEISLDPLVRATLVALGVGLLVGIERERSKGSGPAREIAGVRTFVLVALLGVIAKTLGGAAAIAVLGGAVALLCVAGHFMSTKDDPGITTETALLVTYALGALSLSHPMYSAGLGVVTTAILASRSRLHDLVQNRLSDRELHDGLLLLGAALVVLPLLPNRSVDAWGVINPYTLWVVVVLVMSLNAAAYIALRLLGPRRGLLLAGILGGFVSSVSTHAAMAQRAAAQSSFAQQAAAAANLSSCATAVLMLIVVGAVAPDLALELAPAFVAAGVVSALYSTLLLRRGPQPEHSELALGRPLSPRAALLFGAILAVVILGTTLLERVLGSGGALLGSALGGLVDTHSAGISASLLHRSGIIEADAAWLAILFAFSSNAAVKIAVSGFLGPRSFWQHVATGTALSVGAAWAGWWFGLR